MTATADTALADTATVTRDQAEAVREAVIAKFAAYCTTFPLVDGKLDLGTTVPAPDDELPQLVENYRYSSTIRQPIPWAIVWDHGPFEWAMADLRTATVDVEATTELQDIAPGRVLRNKAVTLPGGVWLEPVFPSVLGIWADC